MAAIARSPGSPVLGASCREPTQTQAERAGGRRGWQSLGFGSRVRVEFSRPGCGSNLRGRARSQGQWAGPPVRMKQD